MKTRQRENEKLTDSLLLCLAHSLICDISSVNDPTAPSRDLSKNWLATSWHQVKTNIRFRELINGATLRLSFVRLRVSLSLSLSLSARTGVYVASDYDQNDSALRSETTAHSGDVIIF